MFNICTRSKQFNVFQNNIMNDFIETYYTELKVFTQNNDHSYKLENIKTANKIIIIIINNIIFIKS